MRHHTESFQTKSNWVGLNPGHAVCERLASSCQASAILPLLILHIRLMYMLANSTCLCTCISGLWICWSTTATEVAACRVSHVDTLILLLLEMQFQPQVKNLQACCVISSFLPILHVHSQTICALLLAILLWKSWIVNPFASVLWISFLAKVGTLALFVCLFAASSSCIVPCLPIASCMLFDLSENSYKSFVMMSVCLASRDKNTNIGFCLGDCVVYKATSIDLKNTFMQVVSFQLVHL